MAKASFSLRLLALALVLPLLLFSPGAFAAEGEPEAVMAFEEACAHSISYLGTPYYTYSPYDFFQHNITKYTPVICKDCGARVTTLEESAGRGNHSFQTYDLGHQNPNIHRYKDQCSLCGWEQSHYAVYCPGPPCNVMYTPEEEPGPIQAPDPGEVPAGAGAADKDTPDPLPDEITEA